MSSIKSIRTETVRSASEAGAMIHNTDDLRIKEIKELLPPAHVIREFPATEKAATTVFQARAAIHRILHGADDQQPVVGAVEDPVDRGSCLEDRGGRLLGRRKFANY